MTTKKKIVSFGLLLIGAYLCWQAGIAVAHFFEDDGTNKLLNLLFDPEYALRMLAAMAAFLAGLSALTERQGGSWLAGLAMAIYFVQAMAIMSGRIPIESWYSEAVALIALTALFLAMTVSRGASLSQMHKEGAAA